MQTLLNSPSLLKPIDFNLDFLMKVLYGRMMLVFSLIFCSVLLVGFLLNKLLEPKPRNINPPQIEKRKPNHLKIVRKDEADQ